jgi:hypothetical protein
MSVDNILNGESGASIRAKLNELIAIANHYSSSAFPAGPGGGYPPPPGGGGTPTSLTIYDSDGEGPVAVGHDTLISACAAYPGAPKTIYYTKGGGNIGAGIEVGDSVFSDPGSVTPLSSMKWYGYQEYAMNKAFFVTAGQVSEIQMCA